MELHIDGEFKRLIPPLSVEEYNGLCESIMKEGCRDAIIVWNGTIIDGHNRYEICRKHGLWFDIKEMQFDSREDAIIWIIRNQFSRRNLPAYERARLALRLKPIIAEKAKENQREGKAIADGQLLPTLAKATHTREEVAKVAGISNGTMSKVEKIEQSATDDVKQQLSSGELSINQAYKNVIREEKRKERDTAIAEQIEQASESVDIYHTENKYRVIYADPPWSYNDKQNTETMGGAEKHYPTMSLGDICALPIPAEDNAVLFLWVTSPLLEDSFKVIKAWGFNYKSSFVWDKVAHNMGHYNSVRHEFLLIATRGNCTPDRQKLYDSVQSIERSEHSCKPEQFREIIDDIYPVGKRIELFARTNAFGWDAWGNMV